MSEQTKTWLKRGIAVLLLMVLIYFFLPLLGELRAAADLFRDANWIWLGIALGFQLISYASLTWLNLLALQPFQGKITFTRMTAVLTSMAFIQVAVPSMGISGVAMRVHLLKKSGYRSEEALASLVVETLAEAIAVTALVLTGVFLALGRGVSVFSQLARYFLVGSVLLGLTSYIWRVVADPALARKHLQFFASIWNRLGRPKNKLNVENIDQRLGKFRLNMQNYRKVSFWKLGLSSAIKVLLDLATLGAAFYMFNYPISASDLFIGYGLILLFGGVAALPGGLGMTEAYAPVIFTWIGVPGSVALAAGLVYRLIAFWLVRLVGYICWQLLEFEMPAKS